MKKLLAPALLLGALAALTGCSRSLDTLDVRQFIDRADDAARKRYAPEICELRGENFTLKRRFVTEDGQTGDEIEIPRALFCREAASFSRIRQYKLERKSLELNIAADRKTAKVVAEYVETLPYYEPDTTHATPDDFTDFQILESRDESVIGFEGGDIVFLSSDVTTRQPTLVPKSELKLPYD